MVHPHTVENRSLGFERELRGNSVYIAHGGSNFGFRNIAVLNPSLPQEVQFDEHKLLIVYGENLGEYERIMRSYKVDCQNGMKFITEAEHVHSSSEVFADQFDQLRSRLGMDAAYDLA